MFAATIFLACLPGVVSVIESSSIHPAAKGADEDFLAGEHLNQNQQSVVTLTVPHLSKTLKHVWEKVKSDTVMMEQIPPDRVSILTSTLQKATKELDRIPDKPVTMQIHLNSAGDGIGVSGPDQRYKPLPNIPRLGHYISQLKVHEKHLMGATLSKPHHQPLAMTRQMAADLQSLEFELERADEPEADGEAEADSVTAAAPSDPQKKTSPWKYIRSTVYFTLLPVWAAFWMIGLYFIMVSIAYVSNGGHWYHFLWMFALGLFVFVANIGVPVWLFNRST